MGGVGRRGRWSSITLMRDLVDRLVEEWRRQPREVGTRLTTRPEHNPDRMRYKGGYISALDFNVKTVEPSEDF